MLLDPENLIKLSIQYDKSEWSIDLVFRSYMFTQKFENINLQEYKYGEKVHIFQGLFALLVSVVVFFCYH